MALLSPFQLPHGLLISSLVTQFPCRESQIRSLVSLLSPHFKIPKNIVVYGLEATGKSSITAAALSRLSSSHVYLELEDDGIDSGGTKTLQYAVVKSAECFTGRHLLETIVSVIANAIDWKDRVYKCENLPHLAVEISRLLGGSYYRLKRHGRGEPSNSNFVLVLDGIDKQRDAPPTLLPALARMGEIASIPGFTIIFIVTYPRPHFLHVPGVPHIHFPAYTKTEALTIISLYAPSACSRSTSLNEREDGLNSQDEVNSIWIRFCSAVWDSLSKHSGRDIISFRNTCKRLWPSFIAPLDDGLPTSRDFSRLLISRRSLFQDERVLVPSITPHFYSSTPNSTAPNPPASDLRSRGYLPTSSLATQLPLFSRLLLVAAYLASYTPARNDQLLFMKASLKARRKKGGGARRGRPRTSKHRKISAKLLGPQAFVLQRMLAIFHAVRVDAGVAGAGANTVDIPMAVATLASLRLVVRTSAIADPLDASTKWKVNVGSEVVRGVARSVGVEVDDFIIE